MAVWRAKGWKEMRMVREMARPCCHREPSGEAPAGGSRAQK